jgi:hypothetical protein
MKKFKVMLVVIAAAFSLSIPSAYAWGCGPGIKCPTTTTTEVTTTTTTTTVPETTTTVTVPETTTTTSTTTTVLPPVELGPPVYIEKTPIKFTG